MPSDGPQLEDGYTKIANELLEAFAKIRLRGQEAQIVHAVMRKTYGFNKKSDAISFGQLSEATGINRRKVIMLVQSLVSKKVLGSAHNGTRNPSTIWINKHYSEWLHSAHKGTSAQKDTIPSAHKGTSASAHKGTHKRKKEKKIKDDFLPSNGNAPDWLPLDIWEQFREHRKSMKSKMTPTAERLIMKKLEAFRSEGQSVEAILAQSIERGWKGVFAVSNGIVNQKPVVDPYANVPRFSE